MPIDAPTLRKPLRLWPGVVIAILLLLIMFGIPIFAPEQGGYAVMGGMAGGLLIVLWWLLFSRAAWLERLGAIVLMVLSVAATKQLVHESISNGMMGYMLFIYSIPLLCLALVASAVVSRGLSSGRRLAWMGVAFVLVCGGLTLIRTDGMTGDADSDFEWRWTPTDEQRLLARADEPPPMSAPIAEKTPEKVPTEQSGNEQTTPQSAPAQIETPEENVVPKIDNKPAAAQTEVEATADWPGFRGTERNAIIQGVRIGTDWSVTPPVELWRRSIGPAWSSFAVDGNFLFTQEQRGDDEVVACYKMSTGEPVWRHRDAARFWESNAGAGPRGTPTLNNGHVYTCGATGIVNALNATNGSVVWSRNAASDTGEKIPGWGFASSPLVVDDVVIVGTAGVLVAYDTVTGNRRWLGPKGGWGYSSPHLVTLDGVKQVLFLNGTGAISVAPTDGTLLWEHKWPGDGIVQPALTADGDVLIGTGSGMGSGAGIGVRRIDVAHGPSGWTVKERWTSNGLKPYFNDFVVHKEHAFGFDGSFLSCIDLKDGVRKWKGGRFGHGQLVLLPDQDLLLVTSEKGEVALVRATSDQFTELARFPAIEGKTWNHPVLVGNVLLVRNGQEMAAFRLSLASN